MPTHYQGDPEHIRALNTWIKLTRATESIAARLNHEKTIGKLTLTQFGVLDVLRHLGPLPQCDIAAKLLKSSGNITLVIDNLEKLDLVRRGPDPNDRRISRVALTPAGQQLFDEVFPNHAAAVAQELSRLSPKEQETLGVLLRKLGKAE